MDDIIRTILQSQMKLDIARIQIAVKICKTTDAPLDLVVDDVPVAVRNKVNSECRKLALKILQDSLLNAQRAYRML